MTRSYTNLETPLPEICAGTLVPPSDPKARFSLSIFIDASNRATRTDNRNWAALAVVESSGGLRCVERLVESVKRRHPDTPRQKQGEIKGHHLPDAVQGELWGVVKNSSKMQAIVLQMRPYDETFQGNKNLGDLLVEASQRFPKFDSAASSWNGMKTVNQHKFQGILAPVLALIERPENRAIWSRLDEVCLYADTENFSKDDLLPLVFLSKLAVFSALQKHGFNMPLTSPLSEHPNEGRIRVNIAAESHEHSGIQLVDWLLWPSQNAFSKSASGAQDIPNAAAA